VKKYYAVLAVFALVFAGCTQLANKDNPSLTIRNESNFILTNVKFSGILFATSGNDLPKGDYSVKQLKESDQNNTGYITFSIKDFGIACRAEISIANEDIVFIFYDKTPVEIAADSNNNYPLAEIPFVSRVSIEQAGLNVPRNDKVTLEQAFVGFPSQTEFMLKNTGVGEMLLYGTQPVKIAGTGAEAFLAVQPISSVIAPNSSLPFKIVFNPLVPNQPYIATVTISSNDKDGDFSFDVTAIGMIPKPIVSVTYDINGGIGATPPAQEVNAGSAITLLSSSGFSRSGYAFSGWNTSASGDGTNYNAGSSYTPTGNITLYAKWNLINIPGANLADKLSWLQSNAQSNIDYIVEVSANESISPTTLSYSGRGNIGITLRGTGAIRTVSLSSNGAMFRVSGSVTLVLDSNVTLQGRSGNNNSVVVVDAGGSLIMNTGSTITGNTVTAAATDTAGGGVYVSGAFTMNGGTISGNTAFSALGDPYGGGVYVAPSGTYIMNGGIISGNTASGNRDASNSYGGGVYVSGIFEMSGGTISGNIVSSTFHSSRSVSYGGGVYVESGTFTKTGGTITGYASDMANGNVVKDTSGTVQNNRGHAVYASGTVVKRKERTAGPSENLSFNNGSPNGAWDY